MAPSVDPSKLPSEQGAAPAGAVALGAATQAALIAPVAPGDHRLTTVALTALVDGLWLVTGRGGGLEELEGRIGEAHEFPRRRLVWHWRRAHFGHIGHGG